ncbi:hypothetical protein [Shuttleworthella satelles]|uniref:Uncharacterized protein n=1 Tax=Shuttleworthella satelles DSM 14600 TaxID=626523 RepID=C4GDD3_9FIRM|nr:hypothetical protein [Shuttleworthia satelles]EEP27412.1 hypothetical protein GCWU000342_02106 [Shuttleworthia satelles DSM 14600]
MDNKNVKNKVKDLRQSLANHRLQNRLAIGLLVATTVFSGAMSLQTMGSTGDSASEAMVSAQATTASVSQEQVDLVGVSENEAQTDAASLSGQLTAKAAESLAQTGDKTIAEAKQKADEANAKAAEEEAKAKAAEETKTKAAKSRAMKKAQAAAAEQTVSTQTEEAASESTSQETDSVEVSTVSPYFGSDGLLVMTGSANAREVARLLLAIPGHRRGSAYHKSTGLDSLIDSLSVEEATWVIHTIEGKGFGQTSSGYAGVDSHASHQAFLTKQVNRRFGGNIRTLLKKWGTYSYGGY